MDVDLTTRGRYLTDGRKAKFPIYFYRGVWVHFDCNMGGTSNVCRVFLLRDATE